MRKSAVLQNIIPLEHERRFWLKDNQLPFGFTRYTPTIIIQGYLDDHLKTRVRDQCTNENHVYTMTRKTGTGISRYEEENIISKQDFDILWERVVYQLIKNRYFIPYNDIIMELNTYQNELSGYMQIEVEFSSHDKALAFSPPHWFGEEVTDNIRHENYFLAKLGIPN